MVYWAELGNLCSTYRRFTDEVQFLRSQLAANGYPVNFLDACVRRFVTNQFTLRLPPVAGPDKNRIVFTLPYAGALSLSLDRRLKRLYSSVAPAIDLRCIFVSSNRLSRLSKLKARFDTKTLSNVVYRVQCKNCEAFYVGQTTRRLGQRLSEHQTSDKSALFRHSEELDHIINYSETQVLDNDNQKQRLLIKETLHIKDLKADSSLNKNIGRFETLLW